MERESERDGSMKYRKVHIWLGIRDGEEAGINPRKMLQKGFSNLMTF